MKRRNGAVIYSPSDLITFMTSEFASWMNRFHLECPNVVSPDEESEEDQLVQNMGMAHEKRVCAELSTAGRDVFEIPATGDRFKATQQAMRAGKEIIYQAALRSGQFEGYADFLERVDGPSVLGAYLYWVWDTKLSRRTKPYFLVQLCCYAEMLEALQGRRPDELQVVLGNGKRACFRTEDYFHYYAQIKKEFLRQQAEFDPKCKPEPTGFEDCGRWSGHAEKVLEACDHLSRVANITAVQARRLDAAKISTMAELAKSKIAAVKKMQPAIFDRLRQQARLQIESVGLEKPKFELIPPDPFDPRRGLALLPPASKGDVYFDMEGYPFIGDGLEYLFGAAHVEGGKNKYEDWWAHDARQEKAAFEGFVRWAHGRWRKNPSMHIYHYASYEVTALRRLMGRHGTCEDEVDDLLRNNVFVDLFTVVRQGIRVGEPRYSIKNIERLYMDARQGAVATAGGSMVYYQHWIETPDGADEKTSPTLKSIREYNREDCISTILLVDWLRGTQHDAGNAWIPSGHGGDDGAQEPAAMTPARELAEKIIAGSEGLTGEKRCVSELLAWLLEFHRRESKPVWWAMFNRHEMTEDELVEDLDCLGALRRTKRGPIAVKRSMLYEYEFDPAQDTKLSAGDSCYFAHDLDREATIEEFSRASGRVTLLIGGKQVAPPERLSLIPNEFVRPRPIPESILNTVQEWHESDKLPPALRDFLLRARPRINGCARGPIIPTGTDAVEGACRAVANLDGSTICIQGPPGTGKTTTAAEVILSLKGKKIGITANSHKVICNLMDRIAKLANERKFRLRLVKIGGDPDDPIFQHEAIEYEGRVADVDFSSADIFGGTAWAFSNQAARGQLDYLFVDEAGQVSVANLVGMAPSARNIVLMGDQMQLSQPTRGSHPGESGLSALDYLLQGKATIPTDLGIFLEKTWRMHSDVCRFISESVYEGRLHAEDFTKNRVVRVPTKGSGLITREAGIVFVPVQHEGNAQCSEEEVKTIQDVVRQLTGRELTDEKGKSFKRLGLEDILFVSPYNMQVRMLQAALGVSARVGSIDKFQGQEAPVVIISMCSSSGDASPRGLEFLLDLNRINVAISRAESLAIVVGSPALARARCSTPEQMRLVNLFCKIVNLESSD